MRALLTITCAACALAAAGQIKVDRLGVNYHHAQSGAIQQGNATPFDYATHDRFYAHRHKDYLESGSEWGGLIRTYPAPEPTLGDWFDSNEPPSRDNYKVVHFLRQAMDPGGRIWVTNESPGTTYDLDGDGDTGDYAEAARFPCKDVYEEWAAGLGAARGNGLSDGEQLGFEWFRAALPMYYRVRPVAMELTNEDWCPSEGAFWDDYEYGAMLAIREFLKGDNPFVSYTPDPNQVWIALGAKHMYTRPTESYMPKQGVIDQGPENTRPEVVAMLDSLGLANPGTVWATTHTYPAEDGYPSASQGRSFSGYALGNAGQDMFASREWVDIYDYTAWLDANFSFRVPFAQTEFSVDVDGAFSGQHNHDGDQNSGEYMPYDTTLKAQTWTFMELLADSILALQDRLDRPTLGFYYQACEQKASLQDWQNGTANGTAYPNLETDFANAEGHPQSVHFQEGRFTGGNIQNRSGDKSENYYRARAYGQDVDPWAGGPGGSVSVGYSDGTNGFDVAPGATFVYARGDVLRALVGERPRTEVYDQRDHDFVINNPDGASVTGVTYAGDPGFSFGAIANAGYTPSDGYARRVDFDPAAGDGRPATTPYEVTLTVTFDDGSVVPIVARAYADIDPARTGSDYVVEPASGVAVPGQSLTFAVTRQVGAPLAGSGGTGSYYDFDASSVIDVLLLNPGERRTFTLPFTDETVNAGTTDVSSFIEASGRWRYDYTLRLSAPEYRAVPTIRVAGDPNRLNLPAATDRSALLAVDEVTGALYQRLAGASAWELVESGGVSDADEARIAALEQQATTFATDARVTQVDTDLQASINDVEDRVGQAEDELLIINVDAARLSGVVDELRDDYAALAARIAILEGGNAGGGGGTGPTPPTDAVVLVEVGQSNGGFATAQELVAFGYDVSQPLPRVRVKDDADPANAPVPMVLPTLANSGVTNVGGDDTRISIEAELAALLEADDREIYYVEGHKASQPLKPAFFPGGDVDDDVWPRVEALLQWLGAQGTAYQVYLYVQQGESNGDPAVFSADFRELVDLWDGRVDSSFTVLHGGISDRQTFYRKNNDTLRAIAARDPRVEFLETTLVTLRVNPDSTYDVHFDVAGQADRARVLYSRIWEGAADYASIGGPRGPGATFGETGAVLPIPGVTDFQTVGPGGVEVRSIVIDNRTEEELRVDAVTLLGGLPDGISVDLNEWESIAPYGRKKFDVTYRRDDDPFTGARSATYDVTFKSPSNQSFQFDLAMTPD